MFDMGITEMLLIGIVALIVIGPERLPGVARTAGKYFAKLRNFMTSVRSDVESELRADELREMLAQQKEELQSLKNVVQDAGKDVGMDEIAKSIDDAMPKPGSRTESSIVTETEKNWTSDLVPPQTVASETPADSAKNSAASTQPKSATTARPRAKSAPGTKAKVAAKSKAKAAAKPKAAAKSKTASKSKVQKAT